MPYNILSKKYIMAIFCGMCNFSDSCVKNLRRGSGLGMYGPGVQKVLDIEPPVS